VKDGCDLDERYEHKRITIWSGCSNVFVNYAAMQAVFAGGGGGGQCHASIWGACCHGAATPAAPWRANSEIRFLIIFLDTAFFQNGVVLFGDLIL
jgi:hypothetical protein